MCYYKILNRTRALEVDSNYLHLYYNIMIVILWLMHLIYELCTCHCNWQHDIGSALEFYACYDFIYQKHPVYG